MIAGTIKLLLPAAPVKREMSAFAKFMMYCWCEGLALLLRLNPHLAGDVQGLEGLSKENRDHLIFHHHNEADIVILCLLFRKHIPMNKSVLKQQLAWIPFLRLACRALDMPLIKYYSGACLLRHPA